MVIVLELCAQCARTHDYMLSTHTHARAHTRAYNVCSSHPWNVQFCAEQENQNRARPTRRVLCVCVVGSPFYTIPSVVAEIQADHHDDRLIGSSHINDALSVALRLLISKRTHTCTKVHDIHDVLWHPYMVRPVCGRHMQ